MFYLSAYLEEHCEDYYQALRNISQQKDWNTWLAFFLQSIEYQATVNAARVRKIHLLYLEMKEKMRNITRSQYSIQALDALFCRPIFQTSDFSMHSNIPRQTALTILRQLRASEILKVIREQSGRSPAVLVFHDLLAITEEKEFL